MTGTRGSLLIVEDEVQWRGIYTRAARAEGVESIRIAKDLPTALGLVDQTRFAVAFVDIGLDGNDGRNADGLRVMEKIRAIGDPTTIVVVTGRIGEDVVAILGDAYKRYEVYEIVGKLKTGPEDLRRLVRSGLAAFDEKVSAEDSAAHEVVRGDLEGWQWDDQMLRTTGVVGGIAGLYDFVDRLMAGVLPVVSMRDSRALVRQDRATGIVHGSLWSRSLGHAVAVCFGKRDLASPEIARATRTGTLLGRYEVAAPVRERTSHGLAGAVFSQPEIGRDCFSEQSAAGTSSIASDG